MLRMKIRQNTLLCFTSEDNERIGTRMAKEAEKVLIQKTERSKWTKNEGKHYRKEELYDDGEILSDASSCRRRVASFVLDK